MKTVRIGSGAGYGGDRVEPALELIKKGNIDYIIFECLAERTIALAQKEKLVDKSKGYNPLLEYRFERILPLLKEHKVKIITNMGAANPVSAVEKVVEMAKREGLSNLKVVALVGDDITNELPNYYFTPIMETGESLETIKDKIISANAYIGAQKISEALSEGADIIITGRVADPALVVGPLMYEFGKAYDDYDFLGKATVTGHLLECAGQVTGGYFADPGYKDVDRLWDLGFPIAEVDENGKIIISKLPEAGGEVTIDTVKEQLLYEIQNPSSYLTPDVNADFSKVCVKQISKDNVEVDGATGINKTGNLKVSVGYVDGFIGEGEISYGGHNALNRAKLASEIVLKRLELLDIHYEEIKVEYIGYNSLYKDQITEKIVSSGNEISEIRLRIAVRTDDEELAKVIGREVEALYTNGPSGGGGARARVTKVVSVASILIPEEVPTLKLIWKEV